MRGFKAAIFPEASQDVPFSSATKPIILMMKLVIDS